MLESNVNIVNYYDFEDFLFGWGARRILECQKLTNSWYKNQQIEEPLSESSRNYGKILVIYNFLRFKCLLLAYY